MLRDNSDVLNEGSSFHYEEYNKALVKSRLNVCFTEIREIRAGTDF